jgi:8-oxo-dGTP diphosphatase
MTLRPTARVLLLDPQGRILLMRGRLAGAPDAARFWFTIGGGVEPGESLEAAARREIWEETGLERVRLGPVVWRRRGLVPNMETGDPVLFDESYWVAWCEGGEAVRTGWNAMEQRLVDAIRWWTVDEIAASTEPVYPVGLAERLAELIAGRLPATPLWISDEGCGE